MEWLKNSGIRTHKGNVFSFGRVSEMLRNKKYIGEFYYNGELYEDTIEPIVDKKLFFKAQEKLAQNIYKSARAKASEKYILSGKLVCAECGELMTAESGTSKTDAVYLYYKCSAKKKNASTCPSKAVKKDVIEKAVYRAIIKALRDESFIRQVAAKAVEIHNADLEEGNDLKILRKQKAEVEKQINNITSAICQGIFNEFTQAKMVELSNAKKELDIQIAEEETRTVVPLRETRVTSFLKNYAEIVKAADKEESLENMKRLIDVFVEEVIFDGTRFLIVMKTTDEPLDPEKRQKEKATRKEFELLRFGDLIGNRTRVYAVRGRRLNRLTIRPNLNCLCSISYFSFQGNCFYPSKRNFFCFSEKIFFSHPHVFSIKRGSKLLCFAASLTNKIINPPVPHFG